MSPPPSHPDLAEFARAFPFHLVISPDLKIEALGSGLARLDPELVAGCPLAMHFALREPAAPPSWAVLTSIPEADFCLVHRRTQLELRGRMVIADESGPLVFLGSCWLDDAEQLADFGVAIEQFPPVQESVVAPPDRPAELPNDPVALVARCRRLEQCLRLHQAVSRCLAESRDADGALNQLVEVLSRELGWPGAALWHKGPVGEPLLGRGFPEDDQAPSLMLELARRAFRTGAPVWSTDGCAGRGGLAIPANTDDGTVAVVTCVSQVVEPDDELANEIYLTAGQLARFLIRQQQKVRLTRLTSELSTIFQLCEDGFVAFNGDGALTYLNPAFARMIGLDRDELLGINEAQFEQRLTALLDPKQPDWRASNGDQVIQLSQPRVAILQRSRRDARDLDGRLIGRLFYFRDITLETELLRANGEFLANAAHELRTPMASIHGFVELLLKQSLSPEKQRQVLETVQSQTSRLIGIVNELLEVARFDARAARDLVCRPQPLAPVIRSTVAELLVRDDPRAVALVLPEESLAPAVNIDRDRFVQALTNVLSNAYKYSPQGGEITLRLREKTRSEQNWVGIAVRDQGIGMTPEELQHLFDRFFRARPAGTIPGTGLGMSMVKKIIDAHGGMVEVDSTPGYGTEVTLWLPRLVGSVDE